MQQDRLSNFSNLEAINDEDKTQLPWLRQSRSLLLLQRPVRLLFCFYKIAFSQRDPAGFQRGQEDSTCSMIHKSSPRRPSCSFAPLCPQANLAKYGRETTMNHDQLQKKRQRYTSKMETSITQTCREVILPGKVQNSASCHFFPRPLQVISWPSFAIQWVTNTELHKQAGWIQTSFSPEPCDLWQHDCCAGQIPISSPTGLGMCVLNTPSYQEPRRQLVGLLQKHNFSHQCTSMLGSSATLQYGHVPKWILTEPKTLGDKQHSAALQFHQY